MRLVLLCLMAITPSCIMAQSAPDPVDFRFSDHKWEHRLLFVFAPSDSDERLATQEEQFEGRAEGFRDRALLLLTVVSATDGTLRSAPGDEPTPLTEAAIGRLYGRFDVPPDAFRVILVGKDGTEKQRNAEPVRPRSVFDTIDAMPMRQREMRESDE